jgi:hypothetical protein
MSTAANLIALREDRPFPGSPIALRPDKVEIFDQAEF